MKPKVLILDEPAAGLDPKGRDEILGGIKALHEKQKITVVLVSHSMEDIANLVDKLHRAETCHPPTAVTTSP
jgi:energy-coupling factor transport system ATP-binding protein